MVERLPVSGNAAAILRIAGRHGAGTPAAASR
jgi:hypothetical protein